MALQLTASIYGKNGYDWNRTSGVTYGFPTQGIIIEALSPAVSYSGVSCNSIIKVLPTGLNVDADKYYTPVATATLITNANA